MFCNPLCINTGRLRIANEFSLRKLVSRQSVFNNILTGPHSDLAEWGEVGKWKVASALSPKWNWCNRGFYKNDNITEALKHNWTTRSIISPISMILVFLWTSVSNWQNLVGGWKSNKYRTFISVFQKHNYYLLISFALFIFFGSHCWVSESLTTFIHIFTHMQIICILIYIIE